mgnify:CR=1 FL=1
MNVMKKPITVGEVVQRITDPKTTDLELLAWWRFCYGTRVLPWVIVIRHDSALANSLFNRINQARTTNQNKKIRNLLKCAKLLTTFDFDELYVLTDN